MIMLRGAQNYSGPYVHGSGPPGGYDEEATAWAAYHEHFQARSWRCCCRVFAGATGRTCETWRCNAMTCRCKRCSAFYRGPGGDAGALTCCLWSVLGRSSLASKFPGGLSIVGAKHAQHWMYCHAMRFGYCPVGCRSPATAAALWHHTCSFGKIPQARKEVFLTCLKHALSADGGSIVHAACFAA